MSAPARRFRLRPRYRGVAAVALGTGGALVGSGVIWGGAAVSFPVIAGAVGVALGVAYLASPVGRLAVIVDAAGLAVVGRRGERFRLAWEDVVRVVASPSTRTCFVDGGDPARSLLVPGDGAPAPYAIEDRDALYAAIVAAVDPARITTVETLEAAGRARP